MCPYCEKTFKTNVSCKKHMKTHRGSLTVNPLGKFPPEIIVENPANLASETVSTELGAAARMYTADDSGTITLGLPAPTEPFDCGPPSLVLEQTGAGQAGAELVLEQAGAPQLSGYTAVTADTEPGLAINPADFGVDISQLALPGGPELELAGLQAAATADAGTGEPLLEAGKVLKCGNCGQEFRDLQLMKSHLESHLAALESGEAGQERKVEHHRCSQCGDVFGTAGELTSHTAASHSAAATEPHSCPTCAARFSSESALARHRIQHQDRPFRCGHEGCGDSYRTVAALTKHNMSQHGGDPGQFNAASFRKRTGAHITLSEEQTKALAETPLELAKSVSEKLLLTSAAEKVKADGPEEEEKEKEVHMNQCEQCDFTFKKPSDLVRHIRTHTGEKPFACDVCERRFTVKSTLRTHMKVHTGGKSLVCHVCQSLFSSRTSLKVHMRLHTGSLPYKCDKCDQRFRTPAHRKTHLASQHCSPAGPADPPAPAAEDPGIPVTISAESLTAALEAVSSSGAPLVGATVQLQLHGHGFESAMTQLQIDEELLGQLRKGENININISQLQVNNGRKQQEAEVEQAEPESGETAGEEVTKEPGLLLPHEQPALPGLLSEPLYPGRQSAVLRSSLEDPSMSSAAVTGGDQRNIVLEVKPTDKAEQQIILLPGTPDAQPDLLTNIDVGADLNYSVRTDETGQILDIQPELPAGPGQGGLALPLQLDNMTDIAQVYICPWCDRVFRTERDRIEHLLTGHGVEVKEDGVGPAGEEPAAAAAAPAARDKVCTVCDKKFAKPSQLVRHMRVHTGERPFACLMCRKSFNQKNALQVRRAGPRSLYSPPLHMQIHMKKHTGERPHVCPFCQYAFSQKGNLKTHIQRSHAELTQQLVQKPFHTQQVKRYSTRGKKFAYWSCYV